MPAILYFSNVWCLKVNKMGILQRIERSMMRAMYGIQIRDGKKSYGLDVVFE